jgi:D-alanyl-D-alanine carboxypeptidase
VATLDHTLAEQLRQLSLQPDDVAGMEVHPEATSLVLVGIDHFDREAFLVPAAAEAWLRLHEAATRSGLNLLLISAFRSFARQAALFQRKIDQGWRPKDIMCIVAPPGYSEHHTGRAVDVGAPGHTELTEDFELTNEFKWLQSRAASYGFSMSYPRDNPKGVQYEPWHWLFTDSATN